MPEDQETVGTVAGTTPDPDSKQLSQSRNDDGSTQTPESFFVGTYKSKEEAERGYQEKDETINRLKSEQSKLAESVERLALEREHLKTEILGKLTEATSPKEQTPKGYSDDEREKIRAALLDHPEDIVPSWIEDGVTRATKKSEEFVQKLEQKLAQLEERMITQSPEYLGNKTDVDELRQLGVPLTKAFEFVAKKKPVMQPTRPQPPASTTSVAKVAVKTTVEGNADEFAALKRIDARITEEEYRDLLKFRQSKKG